jgi:hypothetical protein
MHTVAEHWEFITESSSKSKSIMIHVQPTKICYPTSSASYQLGDSAIAWEIATSANQIVCMGSGAKDRQIDNLC